MGYVVHRAIIVTSWKPDALGEAHAAAPEPKTPILAGVTNGYTSFAVLPDGSREGWPESNDHDVRRERFKAWLRGQAHGDGSSPLEWCEVEYGSDDEDAQVIDSQWLGSEEANDD